MLHLIAGTRTGVATCSRCHRPYAHRSLIVRGAAGAGDPLCPGCAAATGSHGRRLAGYVRAELRANLATPPAARPTRPAATTPPGAYREVGTGRWELVDVRTRSGRPRFF